MVAPDQGLADHLGEAQRRRRCPVGAGVEAADAASATASSVGKPDDTARSVSAPRAGVRERRVAVHHDQGDGEAAARVAAVAISMLVDVEEPEVGRGDAVTRM
ncbi:MAG: hypothetical protein ABR511_01815 [Acidimicrobiales bacterium]